MSNGVSFPSVGIRKKGKIGLLDDECPALKIEFHHTDPEVRVAGITQLTLNNNKRMSR
ncbi:MAG: hypothetical protein M2R45_00590 [Verrucomicrobia subdivision 3 bacterium]|nr:hypothetical protein [Limisphaerales bacterium]MCS1417805.1 hypothetical protein [Limisphaerales bacterium]